jgi:hypothetical protein
MSDEQFAEFLHIFDAQGIADNLQGSMTPWDSATGMKAQVALAVLNAGQVERAVTNLEKATAELSAASDRTAKQLSAASDRIAKWGVSVAWLSLLVALAALVIAVAK